MNIKNIVDKIVKEADINPAEYTVADRINDVNEKYLYLIEHAVQIGSTVPISNKEVTQETFTVVNAQSQTFVRTIPDAPIQRVDFMPTGGTQFQKVEVDPTRSINGWCYCGMRFFADEKQVFIENGVAGTLRFTTTRGAIVLFTTADYSLGTPPSPDWIPEAFQPILWLEPATVQAEYYKKDRAVSMRNRLTKLENLFYNHYQRNAVQNSSFETEENNCWGGNNQR